MERGDYKIRVIRILFFLNNVSKARHFDSVIRMLAERGHTVVLAAARQRNRPLALPKNLALANRSLIARGLPGRVEVTACPVRRVDSWQQAAPAMRQARDYLRYLDPRYAHAFKLESRSATHAPRGWLRFIQDHPRLGRHWRLAARALALAEDAIPSFAAHVEQLATALRADGAGDQVRRFVEQFVRPRGLQTPVTPIMVEEIERAARISKRPRGAAPWHYVARGGLRAAFMLRAGHAGTRKVRH